MTTINFLLLLLFEERLTLTTINMTDSSDIDGQIIKYQSLERIAPSPLFRNNVRKVIGLYQSATATPNSKILLENAKALSFKLDKDWIELHSDMDRLVAVRTTVRMVVEFLFYKLLEDYFGYPYSVYNSVLGCIDTIIRQRRNYSGDDESSGESSITSNTTNRFGFIFPLEEMDLNMPYLIKQKFLPVAARRGNPNNDVKPLIEEQNWPQLATALINDRTIATTIGEEMPDFKKLADLVLKRIDRYQTTYFKELHTPTNYIVRADSANRRSEGNGKSILSTMTASLFGGRKSSSDGNGEAETSSLLHDLRHSLDHKKLN